MMILNGKVSIDTLLKTKNQLDQALATAHTELEITGTIKCFEYTYEISWKTMKKILETMGVVDINNPRSVFAAAYKNNLINDIDAWNAYIATRNMTTHTYDALRAHEVFNSLNDFAKHVNSMRQKGLNEAGQVIASRHSPSDLKTVDDEIGMSEDEEKLVSSQSASNGESASARVPSCSM